MVLATIPNQDYKNKIGLYINRNSSYVYRPGFLYTIVAILKAMQKIVQKKRWHVVIAAILIATMMLLLAGLFNKKETALITTTADTGPVRQLVSVSGVASAKEKADLAFPQTGTVTSVLVEVGDVVAAGETLAILKSGSTESDRLGAMAALRSAIASRGELIAGPTAGKRTVLNETVQLKKEALTTTIDLETSKVQAAKRTLLSDGLTAYTNDANEDATPPSVSGTYTCGTEGQYQLTFYPSNAESGYSFRVSGLESGTYGASSNQPTVFGTCGLRLKLDPNARYTNSTWIIEIPNTKSATYTLNKNAYDIAVIQAGSAIDLARQEVALAVADANESIATPRSEALEQADAAVTEAQARVAKFESELDDRVLRAPFAGTITSVSIKNGEVTSGDSVMTIVTDSTYEITARIPEIDISKLAPGQPVELLFDAEPSEILTGELSFISLEATMLDGVAYFTAYITLPETPSWMRSGLNADIDIIVANTEEGVRIPKRFLQENNSTFSVLKRIDDTSYATTSVTVLLRGNDGYAAVTGINPGDILVAP